MVAALPVSWPPSKPYHEGGPIEGFIIYICPSCICDVIPTDLPLQDLTEKCRHCQSTALERNCDYDLVCLECGAVSTSSRVKSNSNSVRAYYNRVFYFNELLGQFLLVEPPIPVELLDLLRQAYSRRNFPQFGQTQVHELCRAVSTVQHPSVPRIFWVRIPEEISKKYQTRTKAPLQNLRKYGEKWRRIVFEFTGRSPPTVSDERIDAVRSILANISRAFEQIRHSENCDRRHNCNKVFGCRHSIPNTNYIIKKAFLYAYGGDRKHPEYLAIKEWLPQPQRKNRYNIRDLYWKPIVAKLGLPYWDPKRGF